MRTWRAVAPRLLPDGTPASRPRPMAVARLCFLVLGLASWEQCLEDGDDRVLMGGHHQHAAELVEEREQLGAPCVLVVHDLLQVVAAAEVVQEPGGGEGSVSPGSLRPRSHRRGSALSCPQT